MNKAILLIVRDAAGVAHNFPVGDFAPVDLVCNGSKNLATEVYVNSSFTEFQDYAAGRIKVLKIIAPCSGGSAIYAKLSLSDFKNLQDCCPTSKNYKVTLTCTPGASINVFDVLGNQIGAASTPAAFAALWNGNTNNSSIGTLFLISSTSWEFVLRHYPGNIKPLTLQCSPAA